MKKSNKIKLSQGADIAHMVITLIACSNSGTKTEIIK